MDKTKTHEVGKNITLCVIASCFGLVMLLGNFVPSSGVALVLFIMVGLMLSYLTSLQPEDLKNKNKKEIKIMDKIVKLVVAIIPSIVCFIAVQYFYDVGIVEPLTLVAMVFMFLITLAFGIYAYIKIEIEAFWYGITLVAFLTTIVFLVNRSVPLHSNEFVSISEKLEYRKDIKNSDLFFFKFSEKQMSEGIKRYNAQVKGTYATKN